MTKHHLCQLQKCVQDQELADFSNCSEKATVKKIDSRSNALSEVMHTRMPRGATIMRLN